MTFKELIAAIPDAMGIGNTDVEISGIAYDSRHVTTGDLFCAIPGFRTDGHLFCQEAAGRGANAFLVERRDTIPQGKAGVVVHNARQTMALVADKFFGSPSNRLAMIGVTGTNGKTTTTHIIRALLEANDIPTGLTGTLYTLMGQDSYKVARTTPESPDLQSLLRHMVDRGMRAAVMEVSSHALALSRVDRVQYDVAVFTNLTQDHLDFHKDLESYFMAKALLFQRLGEENNKKGPRTAIINGDDGYGRRLIGMCSVPVLTYGLNEGADIRGSMVTVGSRGVQFLTTFPNGEKQAIEFDMTGTFNVLNALAAMSVGYIYGLSPRQMAEALARYPGVPGRFERIDEGQPFTVIVDYAHTPDGVENVLRTAREFTVGAVRVVFGAGGDRDRSKRALMGEAAGKLADWVMLTVDNPRSEDPMDIITQIREGLEPTGTLYEVELDRERAIRMALHKTQPGDVVFILGKGHETYQIYRDGTIYFDDREVARQALRELKKS